MVQEKEKRLTAMLEVRQRLPFMQREQLISRMLVDYRETNPLYTSTMRPPRAASVPAGFGHGQWEQKRGIELSRPPPEAPFSPEEHEGPGGGGNGGHYDTISMRSMRRSRRQSSLSPSPVKRSPSPVRRRGGSLKSALLA